MILPGDIATWQSTASNPFNDLSSDQSFDEIALKASKFPFDPTINSKIALYRGDILPLVLDALVLSTNESLTDRSGLCGVVHEAAGPSLQQECMSLEGCRTGEAKLTKGYKLNSKFVVHTVGPRYNAKYKSAAENALNACYRNSLQVVKEAGLHSVSIPPLYTERKGYPREDAAHIALRTIRRFLERHGDSLSLVVLVVDSEVDESIMNNVMPLYFPRSRAEEAVAVRVLPEDTGNEYGETVVEERKMKIGAGPGGRSTATAPAAVSIPVASFGAMRGDPDKERPLVPAPGEGPSGSAPAADKNAESERQYQAYLKRARTEDLADIEKRGIIKQTGVDALGRPIVMVVGRNLPTAKDGVDMEKVLLLLIKVLDPIVEKDYVLVYVHSNFARENQPEFAWLRTCYGVFSRKYKKGLKALFIVHPSFWTKMVFFLARPFLSPKFFAKLHYVGRVFDLFDKIDRKQIDLPHDVYEYDAQINGTSYYSGL